MGGVAGLIISLAATAAQTAMEVQNSKAQAKAQETQAKIAAANADISTYDAKVEQARAAEEAHRIKGRQRAGQAQTGILDSATGTALQNQVDLDAQREQDDIMRNYSRQRNSHLEKYSSALTDASFSRSKGRQTIVNSTLGAISKAYGSMGK